MKTTAKKAAELVVLSAQIKEIGIAVAYAPESKYQSYWALVMGDPFTVPVGALD